MCVRERGALEVELEINLFIKKIDDKQIMKCEGKEDLDVSNH